MKICLHTHNLDHFRPHFCTLYTISIHHAFAAFSQI